MTIDLTAHSLGTTEDFGLPAIGGVAAGVLAFDKLSPAQSVWLKPAADAALTQWVLALDLYVPQPEGAYTALLQTGTGDADLFLRDRGDGTAAIGTQGVYDGVVAYDAWNRIVVSVALEEGETVMRKFVNGALVGTQALGETDRWAIDPAAGLKLFTDDDGETGAGYVASVLLLSDPPEADVVAAIVASAPEASAAGFFPVSPAGGALEVSFAGETVALRYGAGAVALEGSDYGTIAELGESRIGTAAQFGIVAPGADRPVLSYQGYAQDEGIRISLPEGSGDLTSFTLMWDILPEAIGGYQALLQTGADNSSDADFFISGAGGIGINSSYSGAVPAGSWSRIVLSVADNGDGSSTLAKYIDGVLVGTQSMPTARYTLDAGTGFLILSDEDGEVAPGYLAQFALIEGALDAGAVAAMGPAGSTPGATLLTLDFAGYKPTVSAGAVEVIVPQEIPVDPGDTGHVSIRDMLVSLSTDAVRYDLSEVFGANAHDFTVTNSNGEAVSATITDGVLAFDFTALGLSDLVISAVNGAGETVSDNVRIRVAGEGAYTIAIMPDTQDYTSDAGINHTFYDMTQWLADNAASKGLNFVTHVGDITQWAAASQFTMAKDAMETLRAAGVSFSVLPGNHDIGTSGSSDSRVTTNYNTAFSVGYMSQDPSFGGVYDQEPGRYDNNYHLWTAADGSEWITLNLEFGPRDDVLRWADEVLTQYAGRKAMVVTHSYNNYDSRHDPLGTVLEDEGAAYNYGLGNDPAGAWDGEEIWREVISSHANVVMTAGGHIFGDGAQTIVSYNDYGYPVFQFLVNYQNGVASETTGAGDAAQGGNGGNGAIRLVTIDPENDAIYTETYFTELDTYYTAPRETEDYNRDGLTGAYAGHQEELTDAQLGRATVAEADAGDDRVVQAEAGAETALVSLSGAKSTNPGGEAVSYSWSDAEGREIATGREAQVALGAGVHDLTLTIRTASGVVSRDEQRVIVQTDKVWLVETFNDGNADGWAKAGAAPQGTEIGLGTDTGFGIAPIGAGATAVASVGALSEDEGLLVKPTTSGMIQNFTLVYDLYLPSESARGYTALFQSDITNTSDAEIFLRTSGGVSGLGISGNYQGEIPTDSWNRITLTFSVENGSQVLRKYLDGALIGTQTVDADTADGTRWTIDSAQGFLIFSDEDGETSPLYAASVGFTPRVLSAAEVAAMGGVSATGGLAGEATEGAFQLTFEGALSAADVGHAEVSRLDLSTGSETGALFVKGSATVRDGTDATIAAPGGALFDQSGQADNLVVWKNGNWGDQVIEATLRSMDKDTIGLSFRQQDPDSQYLLTLDNATNTRQLIRIEDGVRSVLATETGGYRFNDAFDLRIAVVGGSIAVSMDGVALFGGAVQDADPLAAGTVGLYSSAQRGSIFDDIVVRAPEAEAIAGPDRVLIDWDGDGMEFVALDGAQSLGAGAEWSGRGVQAQGLEATVQAGQGRNDFTLSVEGSTDTVTVNVASGARLIAADRFEDGDHAGWRIVDTTEIGRADWAVVNGQLVERAGAYSRELTYQGANAADVWQKGWSPQGDGTYALHKGSYALWDGETQLGDYSIQTQVKAPAGAVGLMLNWQDEDNYYKIEIDQRVGLTTLVKVVDGYETNLARSTTTYTPGEGFALKAEVMDGKIQAWVDGLALFADPIEVRDLSTGAAGVWSWGAAGAAFDDIAIVDLAQPFQFEIHGTSGNDVLVGTGADELIHAGAGRLDVLSGGGGADVFVYGAETANGMRETTRITDYHAGEDRIDLGGAEIVKVQASAASVLLWVGEDRDQILLSGVTAFDDLAFV